MDISLFEVAGQIPNLPTQPLTSSTSSACWGFGPTVGFGGDLLFCEGFRLEGKGALSLLCTTYTSVQHTESVASTLYNSGPYSASYTNLVTIRPNGNFSIGAGYGTYLDCNYSHLDLSLNPIGYLFHLQTSSRRMGFE